MSFSSAWSAAYDHPEPWVPGDPWPGTPGGAALDEWSGYIRVFLWAQIAAGNPFTLDTATDRLNAGNVMADASFMARTTGSHLWIDLSCDVMTLEVTLGGKPGDGILSKAEAGTLTATLYDPDGKYDPLNPDTVYALGRRSRLTAGVDVAAWAEIIVDPATPTVTAHPLFRGTADRWSQGWTTEASERTATLTATDPTKLFARSDKPELASPVGAGDAVLTRLGRIVTNMGWGGTVQSYGTTVATLQATTLAQPAWELVTRTAGDELGFAYFIPLLPTSVGVGILNIVAREVWDARPAPSIIIGCGYYDIATSATPASFDQQLINAVYAARSGGTQQTATSVSSIDRYWEQSVKRTDLGLADDTQAALWAQTIVTRYAYPQTSLDTITLRPDVHPEPWDAWRKVLNKTFVLGLIEVVWESAGYTVDAYVRLVGWRHRITPRQWEVEWRTVSASVIAAAGTLTMGPDTQDLLDAGYGLG